MFKTLFKNNSLSKKIHSPSGTMILFYLYYFLFLVNEKTFKVKKVRSLLWDLAKCELFYIAGYCKHTGNCCQNLLFMNKGIWCDNPDKYEKALKKSSIYKEFTPTYCRNTESEKIKYFSCNLLSENNYCLNYSARPLFCKNYPISCFLLYDYIPEHCGYKILKKNISPSFKNKSFSSLFQKVMNNSCSF
ncbi:hypothetical protein ACFLZV_04115 [Candidatus Margulisiibacteriota bacterium]